MASETIKALMMIILFGALEAFLHWPRQMNSQIIARWRRVTLLPDRPAQAPVHFALVPVRVRRSLR